MEQDNEPSKSRRLFALVDAGSGMWTLEVRTRDNGLGSVRLGELVLFGSLEGSLTCSIDNQLYGEADENYEA